MTSGADYNRVMKRIFRILQKVPGLNFVEYLRVGPVCYVVNPKAASRSIIHTLVKWQTGIGGHDDEFYWSSVEISSFRTFRKRTAGLELFTVLRDEEERICSCWKDKLQSQDDRGRIFQQYFIFYWPYLRFGMDYDTFKRRIARIPARLCEKHFMPQSEWLRRGSVEYAALFDMTDLADCERWLQERLPGFWLRRYLNRRDDPQE